MPFLARPPIRARALGRVLALALLAAGLGVPSGAAGATEGPETAGSELIVRFKSDTSARERHHARSDADTALQRTLRLPRAQLLRVRGRSVTSAVRALERDDDVEYAEPNRVYRALAAAPNDPRFGELWGLSSVRALSAWDTTRGSGQVVAVVDTGVAMTHADLGASIWQNPGQGSGATDGDGNGRYGDAHGWDFVSNDADPTDEEGHGTHVAGTVAAVADNATGVAGVAPQAKVMPVRVLDADGNGSTSAVADGIDYAADEGARAINLSLGGRGASQTLSNVIDAARARGAVVIAAAGNGGTSNDGPDPAYPCAYPQANVVCVASIDQSGAMSSFSSYGARSVDVAAPGGSILSTVLGGYSYASGTSMATPHVSAVAALVLAAKPGTSADGVAAAISSGAVAQSNLTGLVASGGRVDAPRAIERAGGPSAPATGPPSPSPVVNLPRSFTPPRAGTPPQSAPSRRPGSRPPCAGLRGKRLIRCKIDRRISRVCRGKRGRARRVCAKRVRAVARCASMRRRTRTQRVRRASCMRRAQAIGRKRP